MVINGLWAIPTVLMIRALRPLHLIRMGSLNSLRIGHFVFDGAEQVARLQQQHPNTTDWFWLGETCNSQWERMIRRSLPIHGCVKYLDRWNRVLPGGSTHERPSSYIRSRDVEGLFTRYDVKIPFLPAETDEALEWLRSKGWKDGEPFVCLVVRDDEYMANDPLHGDGTARSYEKRSYQDYRNSDIATYIPAIRWLAKQGIWVIRMGKLMAKPLPTDMDHVIDYAFCQNKSDLLDIWLFANCTGCISSTTGIDQIPMIYDRSSLYLNALPLGCFSSYVNAIWVSKPLRWANNGNELSIDELLKHSYWAANEYEAAGIDIVDMTPNAIILAVQEFWQRIDGTWKAQPGDELNQQEFWETCKAWSDYVFYHGWRHPEARIGAAWLRSVKKNQGSERSM